MTLPRLVPKVLPGWCVVDPSVTPVSISLRQWDPLTHCLPTQGFVVPSTAETLHFTDGQANHLVHKEVAGLHGRYHRLCMACQLRRLRLASSHSGFPLKQVRCSIPEPSAPMPSCLTGCCDELVCHYMEGAVLSRASPSK